MSGQLLQGGGLPLPNSHETFRSVEGKRMVLIVDDEFVNREMLGIVLGDHYRVIYARDGVEAIEQIFANRSSLALVLLDLMMPRMGGLEVLSRVKQDPELARIPVLVFTADQNAEVESLSLGASDFIPKPYPRPEIILARIAKSIELSEDRDTIQVTQKDSLTGLYHKEFFFRYARQYDLYHEDTPMDAIVMDVNHFHLINERYGKTYGDDVLRRIGQKVLEIAEELGGLGCRQEADTFLLYCPHQQSCKWILDSVSVGAAGNDASSNRVRLRLGVYPSVDKQIDIEQRFDRAKMAADTVRSSFAKAIAEYDNTLHEAALYAEQLLEDFPRALKEGQFIVYYQPKFDIRPSEPVLISAEALVRWVHPDFGMINPGIFIPLFEENGMIQALDMYVWRETASQIRRWKQEFGFSVPVSVNVSRMDMLAPDLTETLLSVLREEQLLSSDMKLEITESAYTSDSEQIILTATNLRSAGFEIEMDDFGTGYSSLGMLSNLPIDALKLDMIFVRNAFQGKRDVRIIELIIGIAEYLKVPVIAEGVEEEEQIKVLKEMGCDIVQGYYFSKPVPPEEFAVFLKARLARDVAIK